MTSCPAPGCVLLQKELHVNQMTQSGHQSYRDRLLSHGDFFLLLYEPKVYFNRAFHNIWQFKPVNICAVEVGSKPGVPWRDNSSGYREKQAARWTALGTEGIYETLSSFPVLTFCNGKTRKTKAETEKRKTEQSGQSQCQPAGAPRCDLQGSRRSFRHFDPGVPKTIKTLCPSNQDFKSASQSNTKSKTT